MLEVCLLSELPRGATRRIEAVPPIAVFHTDDGELYAIDDTCTHQDASLADGWLEGLPGRMPPARLAVRLAYRCGGRPACQAAGAYPSGGDHRRCHPRRAQQRCTEPASEHVRAEAGGRAMRTIAVIGASLAGLSAARALRAQGFDGELTVVGAEAHRPYDRPPLSKEFLAGEIDAHTLALELDDENLCARWLLGAHATRLDAAGERWSSRTVPGSAPTVS